MSSKGFKLFFEGVNSNLYLQEKSNGQPDTIVKVIKDEFATPAKLTQFKNEYNFTKDLSIEGIRKVHRIDSFEKKTALYLDYFDGETLRSLIYNQFFDVGRFLEVAIRITETLGQVHQHNVIHKDINSNNILVNPKTLEVKLIDFGIASRFTIKTEHLGNPEKLEGTLSYISPEQTGRMNRKIDYRTDIYSLGVTFYEMLTCRLPFESNDTLELIHAHLAKSPTPPDQINRETLAIPPILSKLVMKMMAKNAEQRYQSLFSIKKDLEAIRDAITNQTAADVQLGVADISAKFQIPEKLYGRDAEIELLNASFKDIGEQGKALVLVQGKPGVGKSSLIAELYKPITGQHAYFIQGKFDQYQKNTPYFAWVQALEQFINLILTENKAQLKSWETQLNKALDPIGKVLIDLIPDLELIIGPQPEVPDLNPSEAQSRFNYILKLFIKTIASKEHPLVIFIDDWQWADNASINLLSLLMDDPSIKHLMLLTAYRDNEVTPSHPFCKATQHVGEKHPQYFKPPLTLSALEEVHIEQIIADTFLQQNEDTGKLAKLVYAKTGGNAFFVNQFLQTLHEQQLVRFDHTKNVWQWDIANIQQQNITDNVVDLLSDKVQKMPIHTQEALKVFASISNKTDLLTIAKVQQQSVQEVFSYLSSALEEDLILYQGEQHHLTLLSQEQPLTEGQFQDVKLVFKFTHDRIQQAVYSLIPEAEKPKLHVSIGRLLYEDTSEANLNKEIFQITGQFNQGAALITNVEEKYLLARLNLLAATKAKASAAFAQAHQYVQMALSMLPEKAWEEQYDLTLQLHNVAFEADYLIGNYDKIDHWMNIILAKTKGLPDQLAGYKIKITALKANNQLLEAVETAEDIIHKLGVKLPKNPKTIHIIQQMIGLGMFFRGKKTETFAERPRVENAQMDAIAEIVDTASRAVFFAKPNLLPILTAITNKAAYKYNHPLYAPVAYSSYGLILCAITGDIKTGYRFGQVAQAIIDKTDSKNTKAVTMFTLHVFINHWKEHLAKSLPYLDEIYTLCREVGNNEYAGFAVNLKTIHSVYLGKNLNEFSQYLAEMDTVLPELNQESVVKGFRGVYQLVDKLTQPSDEPSVLQGHLFDKQNQLPALIEARDNSTVFSLFVMQTKLAYIFGDFSLSYQTAKEAAQFIEGGTGTEGIPVYHLFYVLSSLAVIDQLPDVEQKTVYKNIKKIVKKFRKWASFAPMNYQHRLSIIEAEIARVKGNTTQAKLLYDEAIQGASENEFLSDEAIFWEVAARFHQSQKQPLLADLYLNKSLLAYQYWGATEKVNALKVAYPQLSIQSSPTHKVSVTIQGTTAATTSGSFQNIDLESIVKGSQTLSGEIKLEKLLRKMMDVVIENAGAQRGILLLKNKDKLLLEAEIDISKEISSFLESIPLERVNGLTKNPKVSSEIVYYVFRTQKSLVLNDASNEGQFTHLAYVKKMQPKSILCLPLINQGNLSGILYLENNLTTGAFTPARIQTLALLSSQIAISIENALLYENLEEKVKERTNELNIAYEEIKDQNRNIKASINYAKRIQEAMLPKLDNIKAGLPESFVLFRPRDIVSGDFYWYAQINEKIIFAAVDCTGHGVPGAFMSMIGNDILNQIVEVEQETDAKAILEKLHNGIRTVLRQEESQNRDGMDMALCVIDRQQKQLEFAGAKNPLIFIRNGELNEIKGSKLPIGGFQKEMVREFESHTITLTEPTAFYMFSDGYADQFGGEMGKKFMKKYFKRLLKEIHQKPLADQKRLLNNQIIEWMGSKYSQTDDILVVGFRV